MAIENLREQIDQLDIQLVELLAKRQQVTAAVGVYKREVGKPIYDPVREAELISERRDLATSLNVSPDLVEDLLRRIMRESYQTQHHAYRCVNPGAKIVIVGGAGVLGRRFVEMFERSEYQVSVIEQQDWANAAEIVEGASAVIVAVPIKLTPMVIKQLPPLPQDCILADLTSLKAEPLAAMLNAHAGPVVGLHPMFGPDVPNFVKQVVVVCEGRESDKYDWLLRQISIWGVVLQHDDAAEHDKSMQLIQAMRHFTTYVYGRFLSEQGADLNKLLRLSSPIYRLELAMTGRLFAQNAELYADIIYGASSAIELADTFSRELDQAVDDLKRDDKEAFKQRFGEVANWFGEKSKEFLQDSRAMLQTAQDSRDLS
ncbi:bifunctional chorismate mutase/prephenate dehydrogenase [Psychrosphaera sp. B3R10]|uniref:bifunctional chorismate mutase/prephenate dehydrogenase n=1 Tax=unclassified Psychrosphaera TaxID=2641570 RepID=UPI001C0A0294|nr:bifunctional chorismate mutase/prephenate dehydrogenase [Psychrosphaera sp. 1_MG-2023]MBU2880732.1 bifunctional chorismate mutase/prephenate dehydrogenase [Psychrosphaera sp. I2R16]MBU2991522.1 bifunctional chorismate mutase/prephenate dehydrogenase [Psychrosphaera sp. B3R10]MDO6719414.1 bifunctional chorismate mutase/prephenate dehydrogenase [Psychrosphaera sp. 1_MG-2023]